MHLQRLRRRFWLESTAGVVTIALALVTAVWPDWLELVFGVDPDHGSGVAEWGLVAALAVFAGLSGVLATGEWRRAAARYVSVGAAAAHAVEERP